MTNFSSDLEKDPLIGEYVTESVSKWREGIDEEDSCLGDTLSVYSRLLRYKYLFIVACVAIIIVSAALSITRGSYNIDFLKVYSLIWDHIWGTVAPEDHTADYVVWDLRLPRILVAIFGGAALAVAGAVMQSVLKNPLADSYTTGVSSGAGFGAAVATLLITSAGATIYGESIMVTFAFVFSLIPMFIIITVSKASNSSATTMIMAGIGTMYIFSALTTVVKLLMSPDALTSMYSWQVGTLSLSSWKAVPVVTVITIACVVLSCILSQRLNVMATGDENAKALGIDPDLHRTIFLIISGILAAGIVSFVGLIGFVGLVAPHVCRIFIGADNRYLIPSSALFGATLMLVADQIGQSLATQMPVGVIMAFFGGPAFILLIMRKSRSAW
ncbi:MAG: iron ABC transporter permease [archaeon]|nr:iron ABC transporter permease [archaeon]